MDLRFIHYAWLVAAFVVLVGGYFLFKYIEKNKKKTAVKFSSIFFLKKAAGESHIKKMKRRHNMIFFMEIFVVVLLLVSLADPHLPLKQSKKGINIVLVIDTSGSMNAQDYKPNRLESAKKAASTLLEHLKPEDYVGIVTFSSGTRTVCYLTPQKSRVEEKMDSIKTAEGQTAVGDGLALGVEMVSSIPNKKRVVVLLTDGVSNTGIFSPGDAAKLAKTNKVQVYTIGLGSDQPVILGHDWFGRPQYAELDEATLLSIAKETGGTYYKSVDDKTLNQIYDSLPKEIEREKEDVSIKNWAIGLAIVGLLVILSMRYGTKRILI
ncbi:MAG: VWA domain-containing protein [Candidatus Aenigmarchaeota archaeon]|nr:VWA domain-containing protein [Candidatus Aenigmarchaeota archaeon]